MKSIHHIRNVVVVGTVLLCSSAAFAQSGDSSSSMNSANNTAGTRTENRQEDRQDYSWLGLLGLAGLAGLLKKPERQVIHQTDVVTPRATHNPNSPNR